MKTITGIIHKILPQSFVDGPGNRTVIFLQGCNLNCKFCHNPQTIQICSSCGLCVKACPAGALSQQDGKVFWNSDLCTNCETCEDLCHFSSSPRVKTLTAAQLWEEISPYTPFISGVTVSGGEPTQQIAFTTELFKRVKQNSSLSTLIESNGCLDKQTLLPLLPWLDQVMMDLKAFDTPTHRYLTGSDNAWVKESIRFLAAEGKLIAVRTTIIDGINDDPHSIRKSARFLAEIDPQIEMVFLRFRPHGTRGEAKNWQSPSEKKLDELVALAKEEGLVHVSHSL